MANHDIEIIRQKLLKKIDTLLPEYRGFMALLSNGIPPAEKLSETRISVHQIAGSAKTFGLAQLSDLAANIENHIDALLLNEGHADQRLAQLQKAFMAFINHAEELVENQTGSITPATPDPIAETDFTYTVIIGDDDNLVSDLIKRSLQPHSCKVIEIANGKDVIQAALDFKPNLIIQDVNMPEISGFDVLKMLKANPDTENIPIVMLTRQAEDASIIEGISGGAVDYIVKPFAVEMLIDRVTSILKQHDTTIMIADDDKTISDLLSMRFRKLGFNVETVENGQQALSLYEEIDPDLIILDVLMPGMDGLTVLARLKNEMKVKTPVVMLTVKDQIENAVRSFDHDAHDYITKPFDLDDLVARTTAILRRQKRDAASLVS